MDKNPKVVIEIDGDTAQDLIAVGIDDLINYFMPKININKEDIVKITMNTPFIIEGDKLIYTSYGEYFRDKEVEST